jgi:tripartite-type tricarboxylate transporter receptor subunit TctC
MMLAVRKAIRLAQLFAVTSIFALSLGSNAHGQEYPVRTIRIVVPFTAGGAADILVRLIAQKLTGRWGQSVIVDNRAGANGVVGTEVVARAPPDGYTLLMGSVGTHAINAGLYKKLPYDPIKDFEPISIIGTTPNVFVIHASIPVKSVSEFVAYAKAHPDSITFATAGNGSSQHMSTVLFESMTGVKLIHVPYKGAAAAVPDLMTGKVKMSMTGLTTVMPYVKAGELRAIGVTTRIRSTALPGVPTIAEAGVPGYESVNWLGMFAPAGTPPAIVKKLNVAIVDILNNDPAIKARMAPDGFYFNRMTPEETGAYVKSESQKWKSIIQQIGLPAQ